MTTKKFEPHMRHAERCVDVQKEIRAEVDLRMECMQLLHKREMNRPWWKRWFGL